MASATPDTDETTTEVVKAERPTIPQDRKPKEKKKGKKKGALKAEALIEDLEVEIDGTTWVVSGDSLNDFELLEEMDAIDSGQAGKIPRVLRKMLGEEQYTKALDVLRDGRGIVRIENAAEFFYAIIREANPSS